MAKPRVFVSSTYFDLRSVRDDLDRFIRSIGYEPVRHERGHISYGKDEKPEQFAYREIDFCEILICIIGGKFGTTANDGLYSITQKELKTALERGKQVYIFVEESVYYEQRHFLINKSVQGVRYSAVDNVKIHEFLEEVNALPKGNPVFSFSVSSDITSILAEQWAGLFQRLLTDNSMKSQAAVMDELQRSLHTVGQLVQYLRSSKDQGDKAIQEILFSNHPFFRALKEILRNPYRLYFTNISELDTWFETAKSFRKLKPELDDFEDMYEWQKLVQLPGREELHTISISKSLFRSSGELKPITESEWNDSLIKIDKQQFAKTPVLNFNNEDDDIPF